MIVTSSYIGPFSKSILSHFVVVKTSPFSIWMEMFIRGSQSVNAAACAIALRTAVQPPLAFKRNKFSESCNTSHIHEFL